VARRAGNIMAAHASSGVITIAGIFGAGVMAARGAARVRAALKRKAAPAAGVSAAA